MFMPRHFEATENRPIADCFVHQLRCDRAVHTTADRTDDPSFWTTDLTNSRDFFANELFLSILLMTENFGGGEAPDAP